MSTDPSDSVYDFVPVPRQRPQGTPPPLPEPVQLTYERVQSAAAPATPQPKLVNQLSASERMFYWLQRLGSALIILAGAAWLYFVFLPDKGLWTMLIGCGLIGLGFALFLFSGPSDAEKRGYHF
jgi:hypothetical protein